MEFHFAKVNGITLHYATAGSGPLLILLHGFPEFWYSWRYQIEELASAYRVVAPDLRGYNLSDKPREVMAYTSENIAKDITELIKFLGEEKAYIIGHDWGGGVAWAMGRYYPQHILKMMVLNCPLPQLLMKNLFTNFSQLRKSWYMFLFQLPWLPEKQLSSNLPLFFKRGLRGWAYNKKAFSNEVIQEYVNAFQSKDSFRGPLNYYRAAFREGLHKNKRKPHVYTIDTRVLWGENDKALGKELTFGMEQYFSGHFSIRYFSPCSHWIQHDFPEEVTKGIIQFCR